MSPADQYRLKLALATHLQVRWGPVNQSSPFSLPVDGVQPFDSELIGDTAKKCMESGGKVSVTVSTVINICQVASRWERRARTETMSKNASRCEHGTHQLVVRSSGRIPGRP